MWASSDFGIDLTEPLAVEVADIQKLARFAQPIASPLFPAAANERNHTLDAARFLAALGVVWVHTVESPAFSNLTVMGTFGVPFYVCVAMFVMRGQLARDPSLSVPGYLL